VRIAGRVAVALALPLLAGNASAAGLVHAAVATTGGYCPVSSGSGSAVAVTNDTASAQFHVAPDGLLREGIPFYAGLVRNDLSQPIIVTEIKVCYFAADRALLGVQTIRDAFPEKVTVDEVIPAKSYSPFSDTVDPDDSPFLHSVGEIASIETAVTFETTAFKTEYGKVTVSTKGSTEQIQIARVKARNPKKRSRYETVVVIFFDSGWKVVGLHYKFVRVPARSKVILVNQHAGYPTQVPATHVRAYARVT
jgi:hypothetical protein